MKTEKIKRVGGSVLFTVVAVMTLLVVFLAGTMILVASANHRSHINYSTAQTTVTSRTVAQSVIKALELENDAYENYFFSVSKDNPRIEIPVSMDASDPEHSISGMGDIDNVVVTYEGKMNFYSDGTSSVDLGEAPEVGWYSRDVIKVASTVNLGRANSTTAIYLVVDPPKTDPEKKNPPDGAGFVTTGGATVKCQTSLFGGAYINLPTLAEAKDYKYYVAPASRNYGNNTVTLENSGAIMEADTVINSNVVWGNWSGIVFPGTGTGVTVWGNALFHNGMYKLKMTNIDSGNLSFNKIPYMYVDGTIVSGNEIYITEDQTSDEIKNPINLFCGRILAASYSDSGNAEKAADADTISAETALTWGNLNSFIADANIYCMDEGETSVFKVTGSGGKLRPWVGSVLNKTVSTDPDENYTTGSLFSKGNVIVSGNGLTVAGDVRIKGNLKLGAKLKVGGDLVVEGNITDLNDHDADLGLLEVTGKVYNNKLSPAGVMAEEFIDEAKYTKVENKKCDYVRLDLAEGNKIDVVTAKYECTLDEKGWWITRYDAEGTKGNTYCIEDATADHCWVATEATENFVVEAAPGSGADDSIEPYYMECDVMGTVVGTAPTKEVEWYSDGSDNHYSAYQVTEVRYYDPVTGDTISPEVATSGKYVKYASYPYKPAYPIYAEKSVLLGDAQLTSADGSGVLPKTDTQVVKTMFEVVSKINPYEYGGVPASFSEKYTAGTYPTISSASDIISTFGKVCTKPIVTGTTAEETKIADSDIKPADGNTGYPVITGSCVIDGLIGGADVYGRTVVIRPESEDGALIGIKTSGGDACTFNNDLKIIVDSDGPPVYFYIDDKCELGMKDCKLTSTDFLWLENSNQNFQMYTNKDYAVRDASGNIKMTGEKHNPPTLGELGISAPNTFIYGSKNTAVKGTADAPKFTPGNTKYVVANIMSSNITVTLNGSSSFSSGEMYYNGYKEAGGRPTIFGCCDAGEFGSGNQARICYIPDLGDDDEDDDDDTTYSRRHWLKTLYYDEY